METRDRVSAGLRERQAAIPGRSAIALIVGVLVVVRKLPADGNAAKH